MSIPLKLGTTTKKVNSTKVPDASEWLNYDVTLKQNTSIEAPVFVLQADAYMLANYNYAVGAGLLYGFYWITDIVSVANGRCEVHCVRDVLADNRAAILATSAFIEYGFNTFDASDSGHRMSDRRQSINETPAEYHTEVDISGGIISTTGIYILQTISKTGGVISYVLNRGSLDQLLSAINTDLTSDIDDILNSGASPDQQLASLAGYDLKRSLLQDSAINAIQACFWLPINRVPINQARIYLGNWDTGVDAAKLVSDSVYTATTTISIPWPVNDWRRNNAQLVLYLPFMGTVPIPVDQCIGASSLKVIWSLEYFSGNIAVTVTAGNYVVFTGSANIAASVAIGRNAVNTSSAIGGTIQAIGGGLQMAGGVLDATAGGSLMLASGGLLGGENVVSGAQSIASGAQTAFGGYLQTIQPAITCAGSMSGLAGAGQPLNASLCIMYYSPIDSAGFSAVYGHPVMKIDTPANGFCKTRGFSLASADRMSDITLVNAAMDGGVFIE